MTPREKLATAITNAGGKELVPKILTEFYRKLSQDAMLGFFFHGKDLNHIIQRQSEFVLRAAGFGDSYSGKPPAQAHLELPPILTGHFDRRLVLLSETLESFHLQKKDIDAWVEFENLFRNAIVTS